MVVVVVDVVMVDVVVVLGLVIGIIVEIVVSENQRVMLVTVKGCKVLILEGLM